MRRGSAGRVVVVLAVACALTAASLVLGPRPASAAERTLSVPASAVTYTDLLHPRTSFAGTPEARVSQTRYRTYLKFDTSVLPRGAKVLSASLVLGIADSDAGAPGLQVSYASSGWQAGDVTYDARPDTADTDLAAGSEVVPVAGSTVRVPLADRLAQRGSAVSLAVGYSRPFTEVTISQQTPPTLELVLQDQLRSTTELPYDVSPPGSSTKKVFAHYMPSYPVSIDNQPPDDDYYAKNYLRPEGEGGRYASVGGFARDRPIGRDPLPGDWQLADALTEVHQAAAAGIDGFTVNVMGFSGPTWERALTVARAAGESGTGFVTVPNLDLTSPVADTPIPTIAAQLARYYAEAPAYRLPDGRLVLSSFRAEARGVSWWRDLVDALAAQGIRVALVTVMLDLTPHRIEQYAPISYAIGNWGVRTAQAVADAPALAHAVRAAGAKWMAPVALQDVRHVDMLYAEAGNTETLRAMWARAAADQADLVQLVTWNDYVESTQLAPSMAHGTSFLDVVGYYVARFKEGRSPALLGDELVVTHRVQRYEDPPSQQSGTMSPTLSGRGVPPRDTVEVLAMLARPATITMTSGAGSATFDAPAGVTAHLLPLGPGQVSATAVREGVTVASVESPYPVVATPDRWDLQYYGASSRAR